MKAQFYFFTGIILLLSVFLVMSSQPTLRVSQIKDRSNEEINLENQARLSINNALMNGLDVNTQVLVLSDEYKEYLEKKDYSAGFAIFFLLDGSLHVVNYFKEELLIVDSGEVVSAYSAANMDLLDYFEIEYNEYNYNINLSASTMRVMILEDG